MIDKIHKELQRNPDISLRAFYKKHYGNLEAALQKEDSLFQSYVNKHFKVMTCQDPPVAMYIKVDRYIPRFDLVHLPIYTFSPLKFSKFEKTPINRAYFSDKMLKFIEITEEEFSNAVELHKRIHEDVYKLINNG